MSSTICFSNPNSRAAKAFIYVIAKLLGGSVAARFAGVQVGTNCRIYIWNFGTEPFLISIGDNVTITAGVKIITHDGAYGQFSNQNGRYYRYAPVKIGDNVFIGTGSILLPGVEVGDDAVIGAGSVVSKSVETGTVVAGNPAKVICSTSDFRSRVLRRGMQPASGANCQNYKERVLEMIGKDSHEI